MIFFHIQIARLCTRTDFFVVSSSEKKKSERRSDIYRTESAHTDHFFYGRQKVGPNFRFLSECHSAHTTRFLSELLWANSHCWITSLRFFVGLGAHVPIFFFVVSSPEKKSDRFLLDQKSGHTNRFLRQKIAIGPCALDIMLYVKL